MAKDKSSLIQRGRCFINLERGFFTVEIIVAIGIFSLMAALFLNAIIAANAGIRYMGAKNRAVLLAEEGLEAARSIRDADYAGLAAGTYGLNKNGSGWSLAATPDVTDNFFTRQITIAAVDGNRKSVTSRVDWNQSAMAQGSVTLISYLTNWQAAAERMADRLMVRTGGAAYNGANRRITGIRLINGSGSLPITISAMTVSWTGGAAGNQLTTIMINGSNVWNGNINSGVLADITDVTLAAGANYPLDYLQFSKNTNGATVTAVFNLSDGSSKTVSFTI